MRVEPLECIPLQEHSLVRAQVENEVGGNFVRIYFRRMHEVVEDFYWVEMEPAGGGNYWAILPKPADEKLERHNLDDRETDEQEDYPWAAWWKVKEVEPDRDPNDDLDQDLLEERSQVGRRENRAWLRKLDHRTTEEWLEELENEPAEIFGAVFDSFGRLLTKTEVQVVVVHEDCDIPAFTPRELGFSRNLTVGETAPWQMGEDEDERERRRRRREERQGRKDDDEADGRRVFHWLCDHIVSRVNYEEILRADETCRACVIAWWHKKQFLIPAAGAATLVGILVEDDPSPPVSPSRP
jgi:hypothetical protein